MSTCAHQNVRCLNHYDIFRKYLCADCEKVLICSCERKLALAYLSHQTGEAQEYGTRKRFPVAGFAQGLCAECRGVPEEPHPRAAIWGQKGKIERYYWREIFKTACELKSAWLVEHGKQANDVLHFGSQFPEVARELDIKAKRYWQQRHKHQPKYDMRERTESQLLANTVIPTIIIEAPYIQIKRGNQKLGKWIAPDNRRLRTEELALEWLKAEDYRVLRCERLLISCWFGAFLAEVVQDPEDPRQQLCFRRSTRGWRSDNRNTPSISYFLPEDFGSAEYFERRRVAFQSRYEQLQHVSNLVNLFDELLEPSESLRDYLWANDDDTINAAREALNVIPSRIILRSLLWAAGNFWERQPGWPDFFVYRNDEFRFVEVKSPHDRLSQEQMCWFEWATELEIPCQILRIKRAAKRASHLN